MGCSGTAASVATSTTNENVANLAVGDVFNAGDYEVTVTEVTSGSQTQGWTGVGLVNQNLIGRVQMPLTVVFENIKINECYQYYNRGENGAVVRTKFDLSWWGNVVDVGDVFSNLKDIYQEVYDHIKVFDCSGSSISKLKGYSENLLTIKQKLVSDYGFEPQEANNIQLKLGEIADSFTCLADGCVQSTATGRVRAVTKECEIEGNKVKFESVFCEVVSLSIVGEESNEFQTSPVTSSELVAYFTPAGQLVYLPKRAIPSFGTKTNLPIHSSALVAFTLDNVQYVAQYKKPRGISTDWEFICYKNRQTGLAYSFENQPSSLVNNNTLSYSVSLGFGAAFVLEKGASLSNLLNVVESFDLLIPQGSRLLGLNLSLPLSSCLALPFLVTSDQTKYYGSGILSPTLPAVRVTPITLPAGVTADIDHALPRGVTGECNVYVIWGPNFRDYAVNPPIEVAKYGMTCQADCNSRPNEQVVKFNKEHNVNTFGYKVIFTNLDKPTAHLLERSLTAVYVITNQGDLPPKHNLPCFKKDDPLNLIDSRKIRKDRAEEFNTEMKRKYGEKK